MLSNEPSDISNRQKGLGAALFPGTVGHRSVPTWSAETAGLVWRLRLRTHYGIFYWRSRPSLDRGLCRDPDRVLWCSFAHPRLCHPLLGPCYCWANGRYHPDSSFRLLLYELV